MEYIGILDLFTSHQFRQEEVIIENHMPPFKACAAGLSLLMFSLLINAPVVLLISHSARGELAVMRTAAWDWTILSMFAASAVCLRRCLLSQHLLQGLLMCMSWILQVFFHELGVLIHGRRERSFRGVWQRRKVVSYLLQWLFVHFLSVHTNPMKCSLLAEKLAGSIQNPFYC